MDNLGTTTGTCGKLFQRLTAALSPCRKVRNLCLVDNIVVLSPVRTATHSVYFALREVAPLNTWHAHYLSPQALSLLRDEAKAKKWKDLAAILANGTLGIVTMMRDPLERIISGYLYNQRHSTAPATFDDYLKKQMSVQRHWYRDELGAFGLSVLHAPRPIADGFSVYRTGRITFVLLRIEDIGRCMHDAGSYLVRGPIKVKQLNCGPERRERIMGRIPASIIEELYSLPEITHCYSEAEIFAFRSRAKHVCGAA